MAGTPAFAENRVALVIGNGAYANQPLDNPPNDAALMAKTLRQVGFEVIEEIDADGRAMKRAVHKFGKALGRAGEDAVGFVFYAGHGIQSKGINYMIPVDAVIEEEIDVEFEGFPASTLLSALDSAGNRLNIVVMDACRNNPYKAATRSGGRGLARMDAPSGTLIAYSTAPGKVAADGRGRNSPYTRALSRAITVPGAPVEEVFKSVRVAVMDRTNQAQVPWESSSLTGDFFFVEKAPEPDPVAAPVPAAPAQPDNTVELTFWNSIKDGTSKGLFQSYLAQYPSGLFAVLAKAKIAEIEKRETAAAKKSDTAFFQTIQNSENKADFQAYLAQYPNGTFASLAKARIAAIEQKQQERQQQLAAATAASRAPAPDPDGDFWNQVKNAKTKAELQAYLDQFPNGKYANVAKARIDGIEEQRQVAALTPAGSGHPADGTWKFTWEVIDRYYNAVSFCKAHEVGEKVIQVRDGKFKGNISSNFGGSGKIDLTFSGETSVRVNYRGNGWGSHDKVTVRIQGGTGATDRVFESYCHARLTVERIGG